MDALQVHAAAAAIAAGGASFTDVAVGYPAGKGRSVRVFYGGQRDSVYFGEGSLNSQHVAESVYVRGHWPLADTATKAERVTEGEMATFAYELRGRINGDFQLGGNCTALKVAADAPSGQTVVASKRFTVIDFEIGIDLGDYIYTP
jgi:hypothetical protein